MRETEDGEIDLAGKMENNKRTGATSTFSSKMAKSLGMQEIHLQEVQHIHSINFQLKYISCAPKQGQFTVLY